MCESVIAAGTGTLYVTPTLPMAVGPDTRKLRPVAPVGPVPPVPPVGPVGPMAPVGPVGPATPLALTAEPLGMVDAGTALPVSPVLLRTTVVASVIALTVYEPPL